MEQYKDLRKLIEQEIIELKDRPYESFFYGRSYKSPSSKDSHSFENNKSTLIYTHIRFRDINRLYNLFGPSFLESLRFDYLHDKYPFDLK